MTMKRWMEAVDFRITEGSDFSWQCFGNSAYCLDSWNGEHDGHSFSIIFDTKDQTVYEIQAHDYANNRAYRWLAETYRNAWDNEAESRSVNKNEAWENVDYIDLEVLDDMFEKIQGIRSGLSYDTRVQVPVDFSDEDLLTYMKLAHERDITFNQLIEGALREYLDTMGVK